MKALIALRHAFRTGGQVLFSLAALAGAVSVIPRLAQISPGSSADLWEQMFPPSYEAPGALLNAANETFLVALVGTFLGFLLALLFVIVFGESSARAMGFWSIPVWVSRGIPDVVFAVLLVQVFGLGPITGVLALALGTFGVSGKLLQDAFQTRSRATETVFVRGGMSRMKIVTSVVLPSLYRELLGQFLLRLEINFRIAIVLGLVGGGGLGLLLDRALGTMDYASATAVLVAIAIFVFSSETLARLVRNRVSNSSASMLSSRTATLTPLILTGLSVFYLVSLASRDDFRYSSTQAIKLASALIQPDFASQAGAIFDGVVASVSLAAVSALLIFPLALGVAALSSVVATGHRASSLLLRQVFGLARAVPVAVLSLFLVVPFGLGSQTSFIALVIGGTLFIGRTAADFLDSTSEQLAKISSRSGASVAARAVMVLAQNRSKLHRLWYFTLDFAFRYSIILGILGSGGLGTVILNAIRVQDLNTVTAATLVILSVIVAIEAAQPKAERRRQVFIESRKVAG